MERNVGAPIFGAVDAYGAVDAVEHHAFSISYP